MGFIFNINYDYDTVFPSRPKKKSKILSLTPCIHLKRLEPYHLLHKLVRLVPMLPGRPRYLLRHLVGHLLGVSRNVHPRSVADELRDEWGLSTDDVLHVLLVLLIAAERREETQSAATPLLEVLPLLAKVEILFAASAPKKYQNLGIVTLLTETVRVLGDKRPERSDAGSWTHADRQPTQLSRVPVEAKVHRSLSHPNRHKAPGGAVGQEIGAESQSFLDEQLRLEPDDRDQELNLSRVSARRGRDGERPRADWRYEVEEVLEGDVWCRVAKVV